MFKTLTTKIAEYDGKGQIVVAANAFGNEDADGQISMPGSFTKTIKDNFDRLRWFLNHDRNLLLGVPLKAEESLPYLKVTGQLNMKKQLAVDTYEDYKLYAEHNRSLEHSIGVSAIKADPITQGKAQKVYEWKWWEFSTLTSWGANDKTPMLEMKSKDDIIGIIDWLDLKMRKGNYSDEKFIQIEKQLNILRTLLTEPAPATYVTEPDAWLKAFNIVSQKN